MDGNWRNSHASSLVDLDPLQSPAPSTPPRSSFPSSPLASPSPSPSPATAAPLSFKKRRAPSSTSAKVAEWRNRGQGMLRTALLGDDGDEEQAMDKVPDPFAAGSGGSLRRPSAPRRISLPGQGQGQGQDRGKSRQFSRTTDRSMRSPGGGGPPSSPGKAPIPAVLPHSEADSTPLPMVPTMVLCIALFSEFLSASIAPFLYFMIEDMEVGDEATVGFWSGIVSSMFFLSQFLTSLLWVSAAEKHGRRAVLFTSLLGNGLFLSLFGTCTNLPSAIVVRLGQGVFNGAVGVARSAVQDIADESNIQRAFTYVGLAWGLGGISGSIIGGLTEHPVDKFPALFGRSKLLREYPYALPCFIASSVCFLGAGLSLFLNKDGGEREGSIQLLPGQKDLNKLGSWLSTAWRAIGRLVGRKSATEGGIRLDPDSPTEQLFAPRHHQHEQQTSERMPIHRKFSSSARPSFGAASGYGSAGGSQAGGGYGVSYASSVVGRGSAYGYEPRYPRSRRGTAATGQRIRMVSANGESVYAPDYEGQGVNESAFGLGERLLLANEGAVFGIHDLWVAAAAQDDSLSIVYPESVFDSSEGEEAEELDSEAIASSSREDSGVDDYWNRQQQQGQAGDSSVPDTPERSGRFLLPEAASSETRGSSPSRSREHSREGQVRSPGAAAAGGGGGRVVSSASRAGAGAGARRGSFAGSVVRVPAAFANTGLDPTSLPRPLEHLSSPAAAAAPSPRDQNLFSPLRPIPERGAYVDSDGASTIIVVDGAASQQQQQQQPISTKALLAQLPLTLIGQYALLALHGTICDQVFMSFIVTPVPSGGLGLKAPNYAELVAVMFVMQMIWQFRFFPLVGPPRGPLSHLAMFRLGLAIYIPVYLLFPELRGLLSEKHNLFVMTGMVVLSAFRYLSNVCAYTAIMVLVNVTTPPPLVPLANGLAQSAVSLARFVGPVAGGTLWAYSIKDGPMARAWPFNYALGFNLVAVVCFIGFLHSFRIR